MEENKMDFRTVFITVGTTSFGSLVEEINTKETVEVLKKVGCKKVILQYGRGNEFGLDRDLFADFELDVYGLRNSISSDIEKADLVIGHAGAGTCLEVLKAGKPLIVVINDTLMDNHQTELSRSLASQGIVVSCGVADLRRTISTFDASKVKKLSPGHPELFQRELDRLLGYNY